MKTDLIKFIANKVPVSFFTLTLEFLEAAYYEAFRHAQTFEEAERSRVLGQLRHYRQNEALRKAALEAGLASASPYTSPRGERYTLITAESIFFSRINVPFNNDLPRPSKYRRISSY